MSQQTALQQRRYTLGPDVETTRFYRLCRDRGMREPEKHQVSDAPEWSSSLRKYFADPIALSRFAKVIA